MYYINDLRNNIKGFIMEMKYFKVNIYYFIVSYILLVSFLFFTSYKFFLNNFLLLEKVQNENNIKSFLTTIDNDLKNLKSTTVDYSNWDDTYKFMKDKNKTYIYENFRKGSETLRTLDISSIIYVNMQQKVIFSIYDNKDLENNKDDFENFIITKFKEQKDLNSIVSFNSNFIYISKSQILRSDKSGEPRGYFIAIKLLDNKYFLNKNIFSKTEISNKKELSSDLKLKFEVLENIKIQTQATANDIINSIDFFDYKNEYIISIKTSDQRNLVNDGKETIYVFNFIILIVLLFIFFFIHRNQYLIQTQNHNLNKEVKRRTSQLDKAFRKLKDKNKELYSIAHVDSLTKIRNRRSFFIESEEALLKAIEYDYNLCILMIDLDHFKSINDLYGHAIGDRVLIEFCHIVNLILDNNAIFGRIGGEEFCITFFNKNIEIINDIAEKIRDKCANTMISLDDGRTLKFTISMGLSCRENFDNIDNILQESDKLLYEAKNTGRNRLIRFHR